MANNLWSNYTEKTATPVDADEVMVRDSTDGKNKRLLFGTFWKWVAKKLNEATISELDTDNKTIIGAINALNGKVFSYNFQSNSTVTLSFKIACIFSFVRTNQNKEYTGIINVDQFGSSGTVSGISIKVENKKVIISNISNIAIYCVGVVC